MKTFFKLIIYIVICLLSTNSYAQDIITKRDGTDIRAKVFEIGITEIKYKKFDNQSGPTYIIQKSDVLMIRHEDGSKDIFNHQISNRESDHVAPKTNTKTSADVRTKPDNNLSDEKNNIFRKFSVSANFASGRGAESFNVVEYTNNTAAKISAGGGMGIDISLGFKVAEKFALYADVGYQKSLIDDPEDYVSGDFTRLYFLLSPKLLIPINNKQELKLSLGFGLYTSGFLFLYSSELDLPSIFYESALGLHTQGTYSFFVTNRISLDFGLKYSIMTYSANSIISNSGLVISDLKQEFKDFNGNGFDLIAGVSFLF